jgi:hypothetical protein
MDHLEVSRREGRYCGWPANYGAWSWGEEVVVGFTLGYMGTEDGGLHATDTRRPRTPMQARSRDGGRTWRVRRTPGDRNLSADEHIDPELSGTLHVGTALDTVNAPVDRPGGIDVNHPDFALMCARSGLGRHREARSWFYTFDDRCERWEGHTGCRRSATTTWRHAPER